MNPPNNQYLVYSRKSTDDTNNQKNSISHQVDRSLKFAEELDVAIAPLNEKGFSENGIIREKHTAYKTSDLVVLENGSVSYKIERPKFQILIQKLMAGEYAGVICLCWDRISRNEQDGMIIKQLMDNGIDIKFVQVSYDKTSSGKLHRDIDGVFANHYSRVISEKVCNVFEKFRSEGLCTGWSPIGYLDNGSDDKPLDPERAPIVKRVFELYATGEWSISQLGKWAAQHGLTTKPSKPKRTKDEMASGKENDRPKVSRPVTSKTIENLLKNPHYIGKHKNRKGDIWSCKHPSLIDEALFHKVQNVLAERNVSVHYVDKQPYTYRGFIRCACSRSYSPYQKKGHIYYRSRCKEDCTNTNVNVREDAIDTSVEEFLGLIHFTDDELVQIEAGASSGLDKISHIRNSELADLERERKRLYADLDYLKKNRITLLRTGATTAEEYAKDVVQHEKELKLNAEKMDIYREAEHEMLKYVLTFSELVKGMSEYYKYALDSEKKDLLTQVFTELIFVDSEFQFTPKEGFLALFRRHEQNKTRTISDSCSIGSGGGIRTLDPLVNSQLLCR
jgi:site-specific DNA recombinase